MSTTTSDSGGQVIGYLTSCLVEGCGRSLRDDGTGFVSVCSEHENTFRCFTCGLDSPEPPWPGSTCQACWDGWQRECSERDERRMERLADFESNGGSE